MYQIIIKKILNKIKMKKLSILIVMVLFTITSYAQKNAVSKHFSQYQRDTSFTKVSVTNKMFSLFTEIETDDESEQEILAAMAKLKGVKALFTDDAKSANLLNRYYDAVETIENIGGPGNFMVMSVFGEIDLASIGKISKALKIKGMEQFEKIAE